MNNEGCKNSAANNSTDTRDNHTLTVVVATNSCCALPSHSIKLLILMAVMMTIIAQMPHQCQAASIVNRESSSEELDLASATSDELMTQESEELDEALDLVQHMANTLQHRRTRLRKRHSNYLYFHKNLHESSTSLEWQNPCNGIFNGADDSSAAGSQPRLPVHHYVKRLGKAIKFEYLTLNASLTTIDIGDMNIWKSHSYQYKFLPTLKRNSSVALKRWYRNMQTFVGSFAYLGRTQYKYDQHNLHFANKTTHELNDLLTSARRILCEIETTINSSYPHNNQQKLTSIDRESMNQRLKFRTRHNAAKNPDVLIEADDIDLKYVKHYYYKFLTSMYRTIRQNTKRRGQLVLQDNSDSSSSSSAAVDENFSLSLNSIMAASEEQSQTVRRKSKRLGQRRLRPSRKSAELPNF